MPSSVALIRCGRYDRNDVRGAVRHALGLVGGIGSIVRPGDRVLLKPNLLKAAPPESCVATHPEVVRAVAEEVLAAEGRPFIGDSPAFGSFRDVSRTTGMERVARDLGIDVVELRAPVRVAGTNGGPPLKLSRTALEADVVINVPKLKAHCQLGLTAGVKNLFGCVPGKRKALWHLRLADRENLFAEMLVSIYARVRPAFTILDAIVAMEGDGPGKGTPKPLGLLLASADAVAIDRVACELLAYPHERHRILHAARKIGLGETEIGRIPLVGERLAELLPERFHHPEPIPIRFDPLRVVKSTARHYALKVFGSRRPAAD
jgi:uncharacterized protein (DUF362 family)